MNTDQTTQALKVGDRVTFEHTGKVRTGVIRSFQWQDWSDEPVALVDIENYGRLPSESMGIRIEQRRILGKA